MRLAWIASALLAPALALILKHAAAPRGRPPRSATTRSAASGPPGTGLPIPTLRSVSFAVLLGVTALGTGACGPMRLNLGYQPTRYSSSVRPPAPIVMTPFADERTDRQFVTYLVNHFGQSYGMAVSNADPVLWVSDGIKRCLGSAGYSVLSFSPGSGANQLELSGSVLSIESEMDDRGPFRGWMFLGDVTFLVHVKYKNKLYTRTFRGEYQKSGYTGGSPSDFADLLASALDDACRQLVVALPQTY